MKYKLYDNGIIDIEEESIVKNLTIRNVHRKEYIDATPTILIGENVDVTNLTLENITAENHTEAEKMPLVGFRSPIQDLHAKELYENGEKINM